MSSFSWPQYRDARTKESYELAHKNSSMIEITLYSMK